MDNDICTLATTIINSGTESVKKRNVDHVIMEEAFTADHGEILTVLAHARGTVSMSGDTEQLKREDEDVRDNCMAKSTNLSEFDRWIAIGHPYASMWEQYRTIPVLSEIISRIWYEGQVVCKADPMKRPNAKIARKFLCSSFGIDQPIAFLGLQGEATRVGATRSKQNYKEILFAIQIMDGLVKSGVNASDICFLTGYSAQAALFTKTLALYGNQSGTQSRLKGASSMTIDKS